MGVKLKRIPQTREEWIAYDKKVQSAKKRQIPVMEISLSEISKMWDYEYQAKYYDKYADKLICVLASNSLNNLKKEIRLRGWDLAWLTTSKGCFSYGQDLIDEYPYKPRY